MRLFTAIDLGAETRDRLTELLGRLRPQAQVRWSPIGNLHITTKFIGEWPEERLGEVMSGLATVAGAPFDVAIRGLGWFPNATRARVLWAGVEGGEPLRKLARATERAVAKLGVTVEMREYSPHLTLARIPDGARISEPALQAARPPTLRAPGLASLRKAVEDLGSPEFGSFRVTNFYLYLSSQGKYTKLSEYPL